MTDHITELLPLYALGALTDEEYGQVETYLEEHPEAEHTLFAYTQIVEQLPMENKLVEPNPDVKKALMARVQADLATPQPKEPSTSFWQHIRTRLLAPKAPAIFVPTVPVLLGLLLLLLWRNGSVVRQLNGTITEQETTIGEQQAIIAEQQETINQQQTTIANQMDEFEQQMAALSVYTAVNAQIIPVASTGVLEDATGKLTFDPDSGRAVLDVVALADDPETVYQLWFITDGTPLPSNTFDVAEDGSGRLIVSTAVPPTFEAIGISIEPPGGSEQPTGDIVLLGET